VSKKGNAGIIHSLRGRLSNNQLKPGLLQEAESQKCVLLVFIDDATNVYAEVDLEMKAKAPAECEISKTVDEVRNGKGFPSTMNFLEVPYQGLRLSNGLVKEPGCRV